ncbi:Gfo/Idh/MocA family protein [Synechocystis sp. CACIAM 05]|uniref:Gfo/Idh/MocA family protein n=1 Tax=Synechocystis sp. CACIAM 05 TaxID=1933929 RepID=UPI00138E845C|nr:Gfo/Idh/MocA family oxidoreductase [Synechocystis sp. CACIAM 05]QHU99937.1 oxidoreductase [Synechocystis sp. CACIAM 05]
MTNFPNLTVAVLGTGFGQAVHLPALQYHAQTEAIAIYHRDLAKGREVAKSQGLLQSYDSLSELLANGDIQAVTVASPPFLHFEMARQAILAGKHVLLEKPMTLRVEETIELYHLAQQRGVTVMPDFEFRFVPAWQYVAELLAQGMVGSLRLVKVDWLVGSRANADRAWNWYAQREKGGGALGALASHTFDYLHWFFGPAQSLAANLSVAIAERPDPLDNNRLKPVTAEDTALISLTLANEVPCQINITSVAHGGRGHWLEIYGEKGSLVLGSDNLKDYIHGFRIFHHPVGQPMQELTVPTRLDFPKVFADGRLAPVVRVVDEWVQSINQKRTPTPSLRHGVYSQLLMDLTKQAHQEKHWVAVPNLDRLLAQ